MKDHVKLFLAIVFSGLIAGIPSISTAAGVPSPPSDLSIGGQVGDDGLLTGMTPGNYKIPSGWTLVRATDFEGTKPEGETWEIWNGKVTTTKPYTGLKSVEGTYSGDQSDVRWMMGQGRLGSFTELYVSWYEFITSEAKFQDEFTQLWLKKYFGTGNNYQTVETVWMWAQNADGQLDYAANNTKSGLYAVSEYRNYDKAIVGTPLIKRQGAKTMVIPLGSWNQWEVHYRQSTGLNNGFMRMYKNGVLFWSIENANINGSVDMSNSELLIGGVYTKLLWMTNYPTCTICSERPGSGTDACRNIRGRQSFSNPTCKPSDGRDAPHQPFKRYFDDIIVMKK